jgi:hypothetical protein
MSIYDNISNAKSSGDLLSALTRAASASTARKVEQKQDDRDLKLAHRVALDILGRAISDDQARRAVVEAKSLADGNDEEFYDALKVYFLN